MNRLLVIVDYQNDFVDGALGFPGAVALESDIANRVEAALAAGDRVVFTLDTHEADYLETREGRALPIEHCTRNTPGWRLYGALSQYMDDPRVTLLPKESFGASDYGFLQELPPDQITLAGVVTNMCVISNAVVLQTLFPQADLIIEGALCDSFDRVLHDKALDVMESLQMQVRR